MKNLLVIFFILVCVSAFSYENNEELYNRWKSRYIEYIVESHDIIIKNKDNLYTFKAFFICEVTKQELYHDFDVIIPKEDRNIIRDRKIKVILKCLYYRKNGNVYIFPIVLFSDKPNKYIKKSEA